MDGTRGSRPSATNRIQTMIRSGGGYRGPFLRVTAANFFFFLNFASFFLLPLHVKAIGGSESVVGLVMGTTGMASLLFLPVVGSLMDRYGRRLFLFLGAGGMTLAALLFPSVDRVGLPLFALRLLQGVSFACAFTATTTFAADFAPPERRAQALGLFGLSTLLTHAMAPGLGEEIIARFGFSALFVVAALCSGISLWVASGLPHGRTLRSEDAAPPVVQSISRAQWLTGAITALGAMGFGTVMTFIATFVRTAGFGRAGYFFAAYTSTAILVRFAGAGMSDRFGRRQVIIPTLLALGTSIALVATAGTVPALAVAGMLFGAAQGISYPTLHALMVDLSADGQLGRTQALFNGAFNLGSTSGSFLFGYAAEHLGYRPMFLLAAAMPVLGSLFLAITRPDRASSRRHH